MAPAAPLLLLLSSALLSSHLRPSAGRPVLLPSRMDGSGRLQTRGRTDDALLLGAAAAGRGTAAGLLLLLLDDGGGVRRSLIRRDPEALRLLTAEADGEEVALRRTTTAQLVKRSEGPPLSIDLTFHLLRNMIQMARTESQRKQTQRNRKLLDEVGK